MIDTREPHRNYPIPQGETADGPGNDISDDMARLALAIVAIGLDMADTIEALQGKAASDHGHGIDAITGLAAALQGKAAVDHNHTIGSLSDVSVAGADEYQVIARIGDRWRAWTIDTSHVSGAGIVRADGPQELGATARAQARSNIGAAAAADATLTGSPTTTTPAADAANERIANAVWVRSRLTELASAVAQEINAVRLGFTPVQQGTGTSQTANAVKIGWSVAGRLRLQVDNTDQGTLWPIDINGRATADLPLTGGTISGDVILTRSDATTPGLAVKQTNTSNSARPQIVLVKGTVEMLKLSADAGSAYFEVPAGKALGFFQGGTYVGGFTTGGPWHFDSGIWTPSLSVWGTSNAGYVIATFGNFGAGVGTTFGFDFITAGGRRSGAITCADHPGGGSKLTFNYTPTGAYDQTDRRAESAWINPDTGRFTATIGFAGDGSALTGLTKRGATINTTGGALIDIVGIPANVRRVTLLFLEVSTGGGGFLLVQAGAGSIQNTGYNSTSNDLDGSGNSGSNNKTNGFAIQAGSAAGDAFSGRLVLENIDSNTWIATLLGKRSTYQIVMGGGFVSLGGVLDRIRLTTSTGTDTFDAGAINILWE